MRQADRHTTATTTRFYWIVLQWMSDDKMFYCSLMHLCAAIVHNPTAAHSTIVWQRSSHTLYQANESDEWRSFWLILNIVCIPLLFTCILCVVMDGGHFNGTPEKQGGLWNVIFVFRMMFPGLWDVCFIEWMQSLENCILHCEWLESLGGVFGFSLPL